MQVIGPVHRKEAAAQNGTGLSNEMTRDAFSRMEQSKKKSHITLNVVFGTKPCRAMSIVLPNWCMHMRLCFWQHGSTKQCQNAKRTGQQAEMTCNHTWPVLVCNTCHHVINTFLKKSYHTKKIQARNFRGAHAHLGQGTRVPAVGDLPCTFA